MLVFDVQLLKRHFWSNIHKFLAFLCIATFGTFIILSPIYAVVAIPVALAYGLTITVPAVLFLIASVCRMFGNSKRIHENTAQKIVHRGKIFYNLGLLALGIGLFFIGMSYLFFPGLIAFVGLSSLASWIVGFTSGAVGIFCAYRSYKNLKTGSISDIKRYILEAFGYDKCNGANSKIFTILERSIKPLESIAKKDENIQNSDSRKRIATMRRTNYELKCYANNPYINDLMNKCKDTLIFSIIYKSNPEVNKDEYNQELTKEDKSNKKNIEDIVDEYKERVMKKIFYFQGENRNELKGTVSRILNDMSEKIKNKIKYTDENKVIEDQDEKKNINTGEKFEDIIDDVIQSCENLITERLYLVDLLDRSIDNENSSKITNNQSNDNDNDNKDEKKVKDEKKIKKEKVNKYKYKELLDVEGQEFTKIKLNVDNKPTDMSVYRYLSSQLDYMYTNNFSNTMNYEEKQLLRLLRDDLQVRVPSAKNNKIWRNIFFLSLGIILTLGGSLFFIYPTFLAFIGLSGLLGKLFTGVIIICGLSFVYESIKNFVIGTIVGFERSLYELVASNYNDNDQKKIYYKVVCRLLPFKTNDNNIKTDNQDISKSGKEEETYYEDQDDHWDQEFYELAVKKRQQRKYVDKDDEVSIEAVDDNSNDNQKNNFILYKEHEEDEEDEADKNKEKLCNEERNKEPFSYAANINEILENNADIGIGSDQKIVIIEQGNLLKLNINNVDDILGKTDGKTEKEVNKRRKQKITNKMDELDEMRKYILERSKESKDEIVHAKNFIIKQNNIKLRQIVDEVLSDLDNETEKDPLIGKVGGPKNEGISLKNFL